MKEKTLCGVTGLEKEIDYFKDISESARSIAVSYADGVLASCYGQTFQNDPKYHSPKWSNWMVLIFSVVLFITSSSTGTQRT